MFQELTSPQTFPLLSEALLFSFLHSCPLSAADYHLLPAQLITCEASTPGSLLLTTLQVAHSPQNGSSFYYSSIPQKTYFPPLPLALLTRTTAELCNRFCQVAPVISSSLVTHDTPRLLHTPSKTSRELSCIDIMQRVYKPKVTE